MCLHRCEQFWYLNYFRQSIRKVGAFFAIVLRVLVLFQIYQVLCIWCGLTKEWLCHFSVGCFVSFGMGLQHKQLLQKVTALYRCLMPVWFRLQFGDSSLETLCWEQLKRLLGHGTPCLAKICLSWELRRGVGFDAQDVTVRELYRSLDL